MLWQPYQTNTGDIIVKVKIEMMTLENIAKRVYVVKSPKAKKRGPIEGGAGKERSEKQ